MRHRLKSVSGVGEVPIEVVVPGLEHVNADVPAFRRDESANLVDVLGAGRPQQFQTANGPFGSSAESIEIFRHAVGVS
jgi:hypothetical protein